MGNRMRSYTAATILLPLVATFACAPKPEPPPPNVDVSARQCSQTPDLARADSLAFDPAKDKDTTATIDEAAPCLEDSPGAKSVYRVFALPKEDQPYLITVAANPWLGTIFAPRALLLGSDGTLKRAATKADFTFRSDVLSTILRSHPDESYLVVASDPTVVGQSFSRMVSNTQANVVSAGVATILVYTGSDTSTARTYTLGGRITVTLAPVPKAK
jgi:hypothetical protein